MHLCSVKNDYVWNLRELKCSYPMEVVACYCDKNTVTFDMETEQVGRAVILLDL